MKKTTTRTIKTTKLHRTATIENVRADGEDEDSRLIDLAFSSEEPVDRWFGEEILDHSSKSVRMDFLNSGSAPFLTDHMPIIKNQVGVIVKASIDSDRVGRATVRLGRGAFDDEVFAKIQEKIATNISVAYAIHKMVREEVDEDREVYRVTDWEPLEISLVTIPADKSVGVGRADDGDGEFDTEITETRQEEPIVMNTEVKEVIKLTDEQKAELRQKLIEGETKRSADILALAVRHALKSLGEEHIQKGTSIADFRGIVLDRIGDAEELETPVSQLGMEDKEAKRFSLVRAMRALAYPNERKYQDEAAFELECSAEVTKRNEGHAAQGIYIPHDVQTVRTQALNVENLVAAMARGMISQRDLSVGTASAGGYLKGTDQLGSSFIEVLRNVLAVRNLGARILTGLVGDVNIPKRASGAAAAFISTEGSDGAESDATFGQVALAPKELGAWTEVTRKLMLQSDPSIDALVRDDLVFAAAAAIDLAAINGSGSSGNPTGILNQSGIGDVAHGTNGAAPTWAKIIEFVTDVMIANAQQGTLGWLINGQTWGKLMTTEKSSGYPRFILEEPGKTLVGSDVVVSQQVPSTLTKGSGTSLSAAIYGNWNDLIIGEWGILDLLVDPYSNSKSGTIRFRILQSVDVAVRHAASFSATVDLDDA